MRTSLRRKLPQALKSRLWSRLWLTLLVVSAWLSPHRSLAQDEPEPEPEPEPQPRVMGSAQGNADFSGSLQVVRAPSSAASASKLGIEIFPEASRVWMSVRDGADPIAIERARRGGPWLCSKSPCSAQAGVIGQSRDGDEMLKSIKVQMPTLPVPVTIFRRRKDGSTKLDFDPMLLGRRSYAHVCAYPPVLSDDPNAPKKDPGSIDLCKDGKPATPESDSADLLVGMEWPRKAELAGFRYLAIVDSCGNARVQPFQRSFTVPVFEVATSSCGRPDGKVLRVFPSGGFLRVTAFNLDAPASTDVMNVTYRVSIPALENYSEAEPAKLLFPDIRLNDLKVDCGPSLRRGPNDPGGIPRSPGGKTGPNLGTAPVWMKPQAPAVPDKPSKPSKPPVPGDEPPLDDDDPSRLVAPPEDDAPPGPGTPLPPSGPPPPGAAGAGKPPGAVGGAPAAGGSGAGAGAGVSAGGAPGGPAAGPLGPARPGAGPAPQLKPEEVDGPAAKSLDHGSLVIAPEPLAQGNCRLILQGQTKNRLTAPLALHISLYRTDRTQNGQPVNLIPDDESTWIVTPNDTDFPLPALREGFDGDSRLKLVVQSDPLNPNGKMVLVGDAGRVAAVIHSDDAGADDKLARRMVGSATIHTVPLCGESNFETLEEAGSCVRAYLTIPAMLATLQITRAPWLEKPLITRSVLSAVGVALAFDSYDPVERTAFPIAGQVGGFVQNLGEDKIGLMAYAGVAPTLPILGTGGNTTTFGFLAGLGMSYITNSNGPDEGFKPTAFISVVVQVGQANPALAGKASLGAYSGE